MRRIQNILAGFLGFLLCALPLAAVIVEKVAIKVNDEIITLYEISQADMEMRQALQRQGRAIPGDFRQQVNDQLINERLISQLAKKEGIIVTQMEVDDYINNILRRQSMDVEAFKTSLAREGMTYESFYEQIKKQIVMQKLFGKNSLASSINVTEEEVNALYQKLALEEWRIMHMYISLPPGANFTLRNAREETIKKVEAALAQNPWNFANIAAANKADMYRDFDYLLPGPDIPKYLIPAFNKLQWNGQVFNVRVVDEIPGFPGFHSYLLVDKRRAPLAKVRDRVEALARSEKENSAIESWLEQMRKGAAIVYMN
ncbi:MAG: SurA N-terminal domain-containing protein [Spirochaetota bacterium]|nr:SurA N-terminal domain-containing protein [Spirochaetota bacterium]